MKFDFRRRPAEFGAFNNRLENSGPDNKVKAIDLPVRLQVKPKELDMLIPTQGVKTSTFLFGDDLRRPVVQTPLLSPLKVYRHPEHVSVTIYDDTVDKRKKLTFQDVSIKDPTLEIESDGVVFLLFKAQIHPGANLQRISDNIEGKVRDFECKASQPELFDEEDEGEEEDEGDQGELPGTEEGSEPEGETGDDDDE